ncbi:hypothetical protein ACFFX0_16920 [Citricoccus parietis]|uniref:Uncharacterized protein n=1 Tax=Citricoccus parietis TaxID=592307 RepID=A0ABV5G1H9_9MICC
MDALARVVVEVLTVPATALHGGPTRGTPRGRSAPGGTSWHRRAPRPTTTASSSSWSPDDGGPGSS